MSIHVLIAAAYLETLDPSTKLVLMAISDSADEQTLEAAPGLPKLRAWSGLSKSRTLAVVAQLRAGRFVEQVAAGRLGRRAVYRVFPAGIPTIPHPTEVAARYAPESASTDEGNPVENTAEEGPAGETLGSCGGSSRVLPARPLHNNPSVLGRERSRTPVETRPPTASGFPGARPQPERTPTPGLGPECVNHAGQHHPCQLCARDRARSDATAGAAAVRAALRPAVVEVDQ